jgi:hypothetical protein
MEVAGNEISGETVRSGDDGPIPSQFVADYFFQLLDAAHAPRNLHGVAGRGLEVGGGVGSGLRGPSLALHVRLSRGNSLGVTGRRGMVAGSAGHGPSALGCGMGLGGQLLESDGDPLAWPGGVGRGIGDLVLFLPCCFSFLFTLGCSIRARSCDVPL